MKTITSIFVTFCFKIKTMIPIIQIEELILTEEKCHAICLTLYHVEGLRGKPNYFNLQMRKCKKLKKYRNLPD